MRVGGAGADPTLTEVAVPALPVWSLPSVGHPVQHCSDAIICWCSWFIQFRKNALI